MADPVKEVLGLITGVVIPTWWSVKRRRAQQLRAGSHDAQPALSSEHGSSSRQSLQERHAKTLEQTRLIVGRTIVFAAGIAALLLYIAAASAGLSESWPYYRDLLVSFWTAVGVDLELAAFLLLPVAGLWIYRNTPARSSMRALLGGGLIALWFSLLLRLISEAMLEVLRAGGFYGASGIRDWLLYRSAMHRAWHLTGVLVVATCALALYRRISSEPPVSLAPTPNGET